MGASSALHESTTIRVIVVVISIRDPYVLLTAKIVDVVDDVSIGVFNFDLTTRPR